MCLTKGNFPQASQVIKVRNAFVWLLFVFILREGGWDEGMLGCAGRGGVGLEGWKSSILLYYYYLEYVVAEWFTAWLTCLTHRPVTNVCAGCGFDPSSRH
jgi:hypothetical protein